MVVGQNGGNKSRNSKRYILCGSTMHSDSAQKMCFPGKKKRSELADKGVSVTLGRTKWERLRSKERTKLKRGACVRV